MHACGECGMDSVDHPAECYEPDCGIGNHWPSLCCPGCPCLSFEEAHPKEKSA